jgi:hypothetical protein
MVFALFLKHRTNDGLFFEGESVVRAVLEEKHIIREDSGDVFLLGLMASS